MVVQLIVCIVLIGSILFQPAKSQGLSSTFGGGAQMMNQQSRGFEGFMSKVTKIAATLFIIIAMALVAIQ